MALNERELDDARPEDVRIAALYRQAATEEPAEHVDEMIRRRVRDVGEIARSRVRGRRLLRWQLPLAAAAVAVVSTSLVVLMLEREGGGISTVEPTDPAPQKDISVESDAGVARVPERTERRGSAREAIKSRPEVEAPRQREQERARQSAGADAPGAGGGPSLAESQTPAVAPAERARATDAAPSESPPATRAPAPAASAAKEARTGKSAAAAKPDAIESFGAPPSAAASLIAELEREPPPRWVERIVTLRREGRRSEADALLGEFKRRFGVESLPPGLRADE